MSKGSLFEVPDDVGCRIPGAVSKAEPRISDRFIAIQAMERKNDLRIRGSTSSELLHSRAVRVPFGVPDRPSWVFKSENMLHAPSVLPDLPDDLD